MRRIRNRFAHERIPLTFDHEQIAPLCKSLRVVDSEHTETRFRYLSSVYMISSVLLAARVAAPKLTHFMAEVDAETVNAALDRILPDDGPATSPGKSD